VAHDRLGEHQAWWNGQSGRSAFHQTEAFRCVRRDRIDRKPPMFSEAKSGPAKIAQKWTFGGRNNDDDAD
jgi:hypothetical protein